MTKLLKRLLPGLVAISLALLLVQCNWLEKSSLENDNIIVGFNERGIESIYDKQHGAYVNFNNDMSSLGIDGVLYDIAELIPDNIDTHRGTRSYFYITDNYNIEVRYELKDNWRFVSKQIFIDAKDHDEYTVDHFELLSASLDEYFYDHLYLDQNRYGLLLRLEEPSGPADGYGIFLTVQNPFSEYELLDDSLRVQYSPEMQWNQSYGSFSSDRLCIGFTDITGHTLRSSMLPEWKYLQDPDAFVEEGQRIDMGEINALTQCMREFLLVDPKESVRVHVGWCENDYQIDIATQEGIDEYKRIIDQAAAVGSQHILFTPSNSEVAPLEENRDAWGWENLLWFNMGQKFRKGEWHPGDPLPLSVQTLIDYSSSKEVGLLAYVFPSMPFMQNPEWTDWLTANNREPGGYLTVDTGIRSFQDWLVDNMIEFADATGATGFSFDHWWVAYEHQPEDENKIVSSSYQQWYGTRRILEQLRERAPELVIDGRQQYHHFGSWTWLAGTYPHPMMSDEQPASFIPITDLSTSRINGSRQRYVAYRLMSRDFTPMEVLPGFITHQTQRSDADRVMRRDRFRPRDWDYLGWRFNLISSVATAPFNHVINYLPARDIQEFNAFSEEDQAFFRQWLDFTDENIEYMRNVRPIIGQPMKGRCDGTSAIIGDNGYIFVFNPNYREIETGFSIDRSINLTEGESFIITQIYPREEIVMDPGIISYGDFFNLRMPGITAKVFRIEPAGDLKEPILVNTKGEAVLENDELVLTGVSGNKGSRKEISVIIPDNSDVDRLIVNGKETDFSRSGSRVTAMIGFEGEYFPKAKGFVEYDPEFSGRLVETTMRIPSRIFRQLEKRKKEWPVRYTEDDRLAPWLDPSRLLLYIQVADPYRYYEEEVMIGDDMVSVQRMRPISMEEYSIEINGSGYQLNEAYNGVYPYEERTYLGIFADVSSLDPDKYYSVRVTLPEGLEPGQFQGIFIENVKNEFTDNIITQN